MEFNPSPKHTVGVEWELQLLDSETLDLSNGIVPLMEFFPDADFVKPEFIQSSVELNSCVAENSDAAIVHLGQSLRALLARCAELEMSLCGAGTHPFGRRLALITPMPRYRQIEKTSGYLAHTQITFSTHVHIGMESGDQAMLVMSRLVPALPALIALSANSPFWRGHETGHAVYRQRILAATPSYGLPTVFDDWRAFSDFLVVAENGGMIGHFKDIHWDIRPHPDFGTLEIRVMDAASNLHNLHGLVAFARCLALRLAEASQREFADVLPRDLPHWILKQNRYKASLLGVEAECIVDNRGALRPLREILRELFDFCAPIASRIGEVQGLQFARSMLDARCGYEAQLDAYRESQSARAVVEMLRDDLFRGNDADTVSR